MKMKNNKVQILPILDINTNIFITGTYNNNKFSVGSTGYGQGQQSGCAKRGTSLRN